MLKKYDKTADEWNEIPYSKLTYETYALTNLPATISSSGTDPGDWKISGMLDITTNEVPYVRNPRPARFIDIDSLSTHFGKDFTGGNYWYISLFYNETWTSDTATNFFYWEKEGSVATVDGDQITVIYNSGDAYDYYNLAPSDYNFDYDVGHDTVPDRFTFNRRTMMAILYNQDGSVRWQSPVCVGIESNIYTELQSTFAECGDLVTTGEHTGEYVYPITCGSETQNVYLTKPLLKLDGYAEYFNNNGLHERRIEKIELGNGEEWHVQDTDTGMCFYIHLPGHAVPADGGNGCVSTHFVYGDINVNGCMDIVDAGSLFLLRFNKSGRPEGTDEWFAWLVSEKNAGHPITIYYYTGTPETETVSVPTLHFDSGDNTVDVGTTVKPSEFEIDYEGWAPKKCKVYQNGQWVSSE